MVAFVASRIVHDVFLTGDGCPSNQNLLRRRDARLLP